MRNLNHNKFTQAAEGLWTLAVVHSDIKGINVIYSYINPSNFKGWVLRHKKGDATAKKEAIKALSAAIEENQKAVSRSEINH
ncbi:hypothetical protein QUA07_27975 [Microcoleus sp. T3_A4]|uniref:hypothetical protein n=1 Tax=Microcoleus sp. T3_A4 TaxID=2818968 RepID=UPI002FCF9300